MTWPVLISRSLSAFTAVVLAVPGAIKAKAVLAVEERGRREVLRDYCVMEEARKSVTANMKYGMASVVLAYASLAGLNFAVGGTGALFLLCLTMFIGLTMFVAWGRITRKPRVLRNYRRLLYFLQVLPAFYFAVYSQHVRDLLARRLSCITRLLAALVTRLLAALAAGAESEVLGPLWLPAAAAAVQLALLGLGFLASLYAPYAEWHSPHDWEKVLEAAAPAGGVYEPIEDPEAAAAAPGAAASSTQCLGYYRPLQDSAGGSCSPAGAGVE